MAGTDSELIALLEREATSERERLLAEAEAQADAIRAEAHRAADEGLAATRERLQADARAALVKAKSTAMLRASSLVLQAKEDEISRVFAQASSALESLAADVRRYPEVLRRLIEEGLAALSGRGVVSVAPADQKMAEALIREHGWEATNCADPAISGGARLSSPDGRLVVTNTLASRLGRARPALAAEVARKLWG
ncbi:MAG: V-type ATP synthase subunit E [bacterium]|nr:V-type ATP synthase subunit E [bacterium]